jgi:uncharacterized protein
MKPAPAVIDYQPSWYEAVALFESGKWWETHEVLEHVWIGQRGVHRRFLGGVILLAAALHKIRKQGDPIAARRLYARALTHLAWVPDEFNRVNLRQLETDVHAALQDGHSMPRIPMIA